uniref:Uncharacterized protein n=1 Tax=Grammatophora oceanica TaxID=210454 RepID=A0A6U5J8U5_9STRA|mmetsp:Transcript_22956/g.34050  ORF Transcript_22956/g.34050 Transcript_22956/m.34050 type:complete len:152 (+) Transcript_22956:395-850(+)
MVSVGVNTNYTAEFECPFVVVTGFRVHQRINAAPHKMMVRQEQASSACKLHDSISSHPSVLRLVRSALSLMDPNADMKEAQRTVGDGLLLPSKQRVISHARHCRFHRMQSSETRFVDDDANKAGLMNRLGASRKGFLLYTGLNALAETLLC